MADQLHVHLLLDGAPPPHELFPRLASAVDAWPRSGDGWRGLRWRSAGGDGALPPEQVLTVGDLVARSAALESASHVLAATALECSRFHAGSPEDASVGLWAEAEAEAAGAGAAHARVRLFTMGPFCRPMGPDDLVAPSVEKHVLANLEDLTAFLFHLVAALEPRAMTVHTDGAAPLCVDAHLAYHRDAAGVADDLVRLAEAWTAPDRPALHQRRSAQASADLGAALDRLAPRAAGLDPETISAVLRSGRHDVYDLPRGFAVLEHPWFLNGFIDRFHLDCLEAAP